jgi:hypothetical protein
MACDRIRHQGWYFYYGKYYCQTCDRIITDESYLRKIIDFNIESSVRGTDREMRIESELNKALELK